MKQLLIDRVINETSFRPHPDTVVFVTDFDYLVNSNFLADNFSGETILPFNEIWFEYYIQNEDTITRFACLAEKHEKSGKIGIRIFISSNAGVISSLTPTYIPNDRKIHPNDYGKTWSTMEYTPYFEFPKDIGIPNQVYNIPEIDNITQDSQLQIGSLRSLYWFSECTLKYLIYQVFNKNKEIELVTYSRQVKRQIKRKTGKAPSPYFTIIDNSKPRKVYSGTSASTSTDRNIHRVRGHFRTTNDHPLDWFNGTKFIRPHIRGIGELQRSQYKVVLKD